MRNEEVIKIMSLTPENLAKSQLEAVQTHALRIVENLKNAILQVDKSKIEIAESLSGDARYGEDNSYIDWSYDGNGPIDISDLFWTLEKLNGIANGGNTNGKNV